MQIPPDCPDCGHPEHPMRMCMFITSEDIHDTVGFSHPPSGKTFTMVKSYCKCVPS